MTCERAPRAASARATHPTTGAERVSNPVPVMSAAEVQDYLAEVFPQIQSKHETAFAVRSVSPGRCTIVMHAGERHLRPGGTVSGPALFTLADVAAYACTLAHVGRRALSVTTNLNINFMRKAGPGEVEARTRLLKLGRRLAVFDIEMLAAGAIVAHATATYSIPDRGDAAVATASA